MAYTLVDSTVSLKNVLDAIVNLPHNPPSLYIDLEGVKLSRHGAIALLQIFVLPLNHSYLIDVHELRSLAFKTSNTNDITLKGILEDDEIPKVIFDVRHDSDALFGQYAINLKGIQDLQVMEFARPGRTGRFVNGLARCIERDIQLSYVERKQFIQVKEAGKRLFAPESGGSYQVFLDRPMSSVVLDYCVQDVQYLPLLWKAYSDKLSPLSKVKVQREVEDRIWMSQQPRFLGEGRHMAIGPWQQGSMTRAWFARNR